MKLTDKDKQHIKSILIASYKMDLIKIEQDEKIIQAIKDNTCTEEKWQELYFRFFKDK